MSRSMEAGVDLSADVGGLTTSAATSIRQIDTRVVGTNWVVLVRLCVNVNSLPFSPVHTQ